jgi:hypothetical protein
VLCDFGSAVCGDKPQVHDAQPDVYRCPEVLLRTEWSNPADIWNVGAMVSKLQLSSPEAETNRLQIWDFYEDNHLFHGIHPVENRYLTKAHLAEVIALLGPPPLDLLKRGSRSKEFFDTEGMRVNEHVQRELMH